MDTGLRISPLPDANEGWQLIKKGESLPRLAVYACNSWELSMSLKVLFNDLSIQAASDDPPPSPAPAGILLCR